MPIPDTITGIIQDAFICVPAKINESKRGEPSRMSSMPTLKHQEDD